jgi:hypothetical protein
MHERVTDFHESVDFIHWVFSSALSGVWDWIGGSVGSVGSGWSIRWVWVWSRAFVGFSSLPLFDDFSFLSFLFWFCAYRHWTARSGERTEIHHSAMKTRRETNYLAGSYGLQYEYIGY